MKKLFLLLLVLGTIPVLAQRSVPAIPWGFVDTVKYPIFHKFEPMSAIKMAELGLRPVRLDTSVVMFNWYESRKRFMLDTLQRGVVVAVDSTGRPIYKADCSNRLVFAKCPVVTTKDSSGSGPAGAHKKTEEKDSFLKSLAKGLWGLIGDLFGQLGWLLATLAGLALLGLLLLGLYLLGRRVFNGRIVATPPSGGSSPASTPLVASPTVPASATSAPAASSPATSAAPVSATASGSVKERKFVAYYPGEKEQMLRFSGVQDVRMEEEGGVTTLRFRNIKPT